MARLVFVCSLDGNPVEVGEHETQILMSRCLHCTRWAVAGYRCPCGNADADPTDALMGHGPGECVEAG